MVGWVGGWVGGWVDGWVGGWVDWIWVGGWVDGWVGGCRVLGCLSWGRWVGGGALGEHMGVGDMRFGFLEGGGGG